MNLSDLTPDQLEALDWAQYRTEDLLALPVGFGKTVICLTAISRIRAVHGPWRTLVLSTSAICKHTWGDEVNLWDHLDPHMDYADASRGDLKALYSGAAITGVNFERIGWLFDLVDAGEYELPEILVIDESSKMKASNASLAFVGSTKTRV
jgi:hypothetical protein